MIKFAVLIPTLPERKAYLNRLLNVLYKQINDLDKAHEVVVITNLDHRQKTTGTKRNELIAIADKMGALYTAFVDDDDLVGPTYIQRNLEGIEKGVDCCSLLGQIYWSGKPGKPFHHSIRYKEWFENDKIYARCINHLNCIKLSLIKDIPFPDKSWGEDGVASYKWRDSGRLKNEYEIKEVIYHYFNGTKNTETEQSCYRWLMNQ